MMRREPLRLLLVDDEAPARLRLRDLLGDIAEEVPTTVVAEAYDGHSALALIQTHPCDIALVDIRMPGMDGVEFARHLARWPTAPAVIFVTAYDQYAVSAFELAALDYLVKPVRAARLAVALQKATRHPDETERLEKSALATRRHLSCFERGRVLLVPVADILYLKAEQKYVTARTVEREYLLEESLVKLEAEFANNFMRVHRNCLVASDAVIGLERTGAEEDKEDYWQVMLSGISERIPVSRRQSPLIKKLLKLKSRL
jgi:two-component system response regulator AlgR